MKKPYIKWIFYILLFLFNLTLVIWALTQKVEADRQRYLSETARKEAYEAKNAALEKMETAEKSSLNLINEIYVLKTELEMCKRLHVLDSLKLLAKKR